MRHEHSLQEDSGAGSEYDAAETAFLKECLRYRIEKGLQFLALTDVLRVVKVMGYVNPSQKEETMMTDARGEKVCPIVPLQGRCVVVEEKAKEKSGGIALPDNYGGQQRNKRGRVVAVGAADVTDGGKPFLLELRIGHIVHFVPYPHLQIMIDGIEYHVLNQRDVLCVER